MSGPKHTPWTPGPWRIPVANVFMVVAPEAPNHNRHEGMAPPYPDAIVCVVNLDNPGAAADARLIAAAPRLAAALKECVRKLDTCEKSYRMGGGQDFANSIAQVSSDARAALREAGVDDA